MKKKNNQSSIINSQSKKVWHIVDYAALYFATQSGKKDVELEAVQYTPRYVQAAWDHPEATRLINRMAELKETLAPEAYVWSKLLYEEMLDRSQVMHKQTDKYLRGYVVDACGRPAATGRIAAMVGLGLTAAKVAGLLKHLERVGLIERVALPTAADAPPPTPPDDDIERDAARQRAIAAQKYGRKKGKKDAAAASGGEGGDGKPPADKDLIEVASQSRVSRESVATGSDKNKNKNKELRSLRPSASAEQEQRTVGLSALNGDADVDTDGRTADGRPLTAECRPPTADADCRPPTGDRPPQGGQTASGAATGAEGAEGADGAEADGGADTGTEGDLGRVTAMQGTAAREPRPTGEPTEAEAGARADPPPGDAAAIAGRIESLYDRSGYGFAEQVCAALGVPGNRDCRAWRREYEAIAAAWQRAQAARLTPTAMDGLWKRSLKSAVKIGRMRQRKTRWVKGPEAVWMHEFNQRLAAAQADAAGYAARQKQCKAL